MKTDDTAELPAFTGPDGLCRVFSVQDSQGDDWEPTLTDLVLLLKTLPGDQLANVWSMVTALRSG